MPFLTTALGIGSILAGGGSVLSGLFGSRKSSEEKQALAAQTALTGAYLPLAQQYSGIMGRILSGRATSPIGRLLQARFDPSRLERDDAGLEAEFGAIDVDIAEGRRSITDYLAAQGATRSGRHQIQLERLEGERIRRRTGVRGEFRREETERRRNLVAEAMQFLGGAGGAAGVVRSGGAVIGPLAAERQASATAAGRGAGSVLSGLMLSNILKQKYNPASTISGLGLADELGIEGIL